MMPSITVCSFLTVTNGFKLFDQNLALTNGAPSNTSEMLALNTTARSTDEPDSRA